MAQIENNNTQVFLRMPFTEIAQTVPLGQTKWPPEFTIEAL